MSITITIKFRSRRRNTRFTSTFSIMSPPKSLFCFISGFTAGFVDTRATFVEPAGIGIVIVVFHLIF